MHVDGSSNRYSRYDSTSGIATKTLADVEVPCWDMSLPGCILTADATGWNDSVLFVVGLNRRNKRAAHES